MQPAGYNGGHLGESRLAGERSALEMSMDIKWLTCQFDGTKIYSDAARRLGNDAMPVLIIKLIDGLHMRP